MNEKRSTCKNGKNKPFWFEVSLLSTFLIASCGAKNSNDASGTPLKESLASSKLSPETFASFQFDALTDTQAIQEASDRLHGRTIDTNLFDPQGIQIAKNEYPEEYLRGSRPKISACLEEKLKDLKPFSLDGETLNVEFDFENSCDGPTKKESYSIKLSCSGAQFASLKEKRFGDVFLSGMMIGTSTVFLPLWQLCPKSVTTILWSSRYTATINESITIEENKSANINTSQARMVSAPDGSPCIFKPSQQGIHIEKCQYFSLYTGGISSATQSAKENTLITMDYSKSDMEFYQGHVPEGETKVSINGWAGSGKFSKKEVDGRSNIYLSFDLTKDGKSVNGPKNPVQENLFFREPGKYSFTT